MENYDLKVQELAGDFFIISNEINELDKYITNCTDDQIRREYLDYMRQLIIKFNNTNNELKTALEGYFSENPDPVKLHYKKLYKQING